MTAAVSRWVIALGYATVGVSSLIVATRVLTATNKLLLFWVAGVSALWGLWYGTLAVFDPAPASEPFLWYATASRFLHFPVIALFGMVAWVRSHEAKGI